MFSPFILENPQLFCFHFLTQLARFPIIRRSELLQTYVKMLRG